MDSIKKITQGVNRKRLYHYTDLRNLESIAETNTLYSCYSVDPSLSRERRNAPIKVDIGGRDFIANDQLPIAKVMLAEGVTAEEFRSYLDKHVFFWPTLTDCKRMIESYCRRSPEKRVVILEFDAISLLTDEFSRVKLCKYNSGSSPLYPASCKYRKSLDMFIPAAQFGNQSNELLPSKSSEIREILVEGRVINLDKHLIGIYCNELSSVPQKWQKLFRTIRELFV